MADWDDEDFDPDVVETKAAVPGISDKWVGEDEDDDIKDNWDDDDEEDKPKAPEKSAPKESSKKLGKKALAKKLKEIEEKERQEREQIEMTPEELMNEKLRMQKLSEESDLQVARDTFGIAEEREGEADTNSGSSIDNLKCATKEDFNTLENLIATKINSFENSPHFASFLESLCVTLFTTLNAENARKISASVTAIANEKTKIEKEKAKKLKGKSKAKLAGAKKSGTGDDMLDYSSYNDFDDFM